MQLTLIFWIEQSVLKKRTLAFRPFAVMEFSGNLLKTFIEILNYFLETYVMQRGSVDGRKNRKKINIKSFFGNIKVFRVKIFLLSFVLLNIWYFVFICGQLVCLCFCFFLELFSLSCRASCVLCILSSVFWWFGSFSSFVLAGPVVILSLESG